MIKLKQKDKDMIYSLDYNPKINYNRNIYQAHNEINYDNTLNYSVINKTENVQNIIDGVLNKTLTMFLYTNLPDTLPIEEIEKILQLNGTGFVTLIDDNLVILKGSYNYEKVDIYNRPQEINCYLPDKKTFKMFKISDGVINL